MDTEAAKYVYPIINQGLALRDRLDAGEYLDIDVEQATLKRLLNQPSSDRGIRYTLVCWLDQLLGRSASWGPTPWEDQSLETVWRGTSDGSWRFWDQARQAEKLPTCDALEVSYLCVMLGFRGELAESPDQLRDWVEATRRRIEAVGAIDWLQPPDLEPATYVPPLRGRDKLRLTVMLAGLAFFVLIPPAAFFLLRQLS